MNGIGLFLGRFHPLVLHFPIALLSVAFVLAMLRRREGSRVGPGVVRTLLDVGALSAVIAAGLGVLLALEGGYDETLVGQHRLSGVALAAAAVVLAWMQRRGERSRAFMPLFTVTMVLVLWTGHLGGTLTHGSGYLTAHAPAPLRAVLGADGPRQTSLVAIEDLDRAVVFRDLLGPVVDESCAECHNPIKRKNGLDLTTAEGFMAGGDEGPVLGEGGALASPLFRRLILPPDHEDAMPPTGKPRLDPTDVELIGWWLDHGASFDATVAALAPEPRLRRLLEERFGEPDPLSLLGIRSASERAIRRAGRGAFEVERISLDAPYLRARLRPEAMETEWRLEELAPVSDQLTELDLGGSGFDDARAADLDGFPHLKRLELQNTAVGDAAMSSVGRLPYLVSLNVYGTVVGDGGLAALAGHEHLETVFAWNSRVGPEGAGELEGANPGTRVDLGADPSLFASTRLPVPRIEVDSLLFMGRAIVELEGGIPGTVIQYTLDGSDPGVDAPVYSGPFEVDASAEVRAVGRKPDWADSPVASAQLLRVELPARSVSLERPPSADYPGNGALTLFDGTLGTTNYRAPDWLGYRGEDLVATLDLGEARSIGSVTVGTVENLQSWIFFPRGLEVLASDDGETFRTVASASYEVPDGPRDTTRRLITERIPTTRARYIRVRVRNVGTIPDWHPGKGQPAWVFVDELILGG